MDVSDYHHADSISIARPPAEVYAIISDVTRTGELSPVCASCAWEDATLAGTEGAWFTGHNEVGTRAWDTHCKVVAAVPGREFTFVNHGAGHDTELVRWSYTLEPDGAGAKVTETWQVLPAYPDFVRSADPGGDVTARLDWAAQMAREGIPTTLANLKRIAES